MADFSALKQSIQNYIKQNGNKEITGAILQNILLSMVTTMGDGAITDLNGGLSDEKNRAEGAETTTLLFSDGKLVFKNAAGTVLYQLSADSFLSAITTRLNTGALYAGYATPSTTPATLTSQEVFYLATQAGTYTNFHFNGGDDPIVLTKDGIYFIVSGDDDDDWNAEPMLQLDDVPTASSNNAVKSGGVAEELALGAVYDVSAKNPTAGPNNDGKWESLSALLSDANLNTLIPTSVRKGGMSIKFIQGSVQSSDNKYVQYRLMASGFTTTITEWQGVDNVPTYKSNNLVESKGIISYLEEKNNILDSTIDNEQMFVHHGGLGSVTGGYVVNDVASRVTFIIPTNNAGSITCSPKSGYKINVIRLKNLHYGIRTNEIISDVIDMSGFTTSPVSLEMYISDNHASCIFIVVGKTDDSNISEITSEVYPNVSVTSLGRIIHNADLQHIDNVPTYKSNNLVKSGGIFSSMAVKDENTPILSFVNATLALNNNQYIIVSNQSRILTEIDLACASKFSANISNGYSLNIVWLRTRIAGVKLNDTFSENEVIRIDTGLIGNNADITVIENANGVILVLRKTDDSNISTSEGSNLSVTIDSVRSEVTGTLVKEKGLTPKFSLVQGGVRAWFIIDATNLLTAQVITSHNSDFKIAAIFLNASEEPIPASDTGWQDDLNIINEWRGTAKYLRLGIKYGNNVNMNSTQLPYINMYYIKKIIINDANSRIDILNDDIELLNDEVYGSGNQLYYGEKINLNYSKKNYCISTLSYLTSKTDYEYEYMQSATIYGGYIFVALQFSGKILIIDKSTMTEVGYVNIYQNSDSGYHANNIQFTDQYYQAGDEFPLCILSYWGINTVTGDRGYAIILRFTETNGVFSVQTISTIKTTENKPYLTWSIDSDTGRIIAYGFKDDKVIDWDDKTSQIDFFSWAIPANLKVDNTLSIANADFHRIGYKCIVPQAFFCKNGKIYFYTTSNMYLPVGIQVGLWVIDEASFDIETVIPVERTHYEAEGACEYEGSIYLFDRNETDASNQFRMNELSGFTDGE